MVRPSFQRPIGSELMSIASELIGQVVEGQLSRKFQQDISKIAAKYNATPDYSMDAGDRSVWLVFHQLPISRNIADRISRDVQKAGYRVDGFESDSMLVSER